MTRCKTEATSSGVAWRGESGEIIFEAFADGTFRDHRKKPPFLQILPCPYCGVTEDRGHVTSKHVNTHQKTEIV
jgi:hypothetical protein